VRPIIIFSIPWVEIEIIIVCVTMCIFDSNFAFSLGAMW